MPPVFGKEDLGMFNFAYSKVVFPKRVLIEPMERLLFLLKYKLIRLKV